MSEEQCLWCGNYYSEGMEGVCRSCWEKYQFTEQHQPSDADIMNDLQRQNDQLKSDKEILKEALKELADYQESDYRDDWFLDITKMRKIAEKALNKIEEI